MLAGAAACGTKKPAETKPAEAANETLSEDATLGEKLVYTFKKEAAENKDVAALAEILAKEENSGYDCMTMACEEGFLNGFSAEVKGFTKGEVFSPVIGSIPFVGYVFETDDADALVKTLEDLADPRWNICTEAAETVTAVSDNLVFFAMCPGEEE